MGALTGNGTSMDCGSIKIFVYGTLRPEGWNHRLIEAYVRRAIPGAVTGILIDLGSIPALIPGDGLVRGVMLTVDPVALDITDRLEGHPLWYMRVATTVTLDDGSTVEAWTYEYSEPARIANRPTLLLRREHGVPVYSWSPAPPDGSRL